MKERKGGGGGDDVARRSTNMRQMLRQTQSLTDSMLGTLASFDHRLSPLHRAIQPTQSDTEAIWRADRNIDKTLKAAEAILAHFNLSRQVETRIEIGPHEDLEGYIKAIERLKENLESFSNNNFFKTSESVIKHSNNILEAAMAKLEEEFQQILSSYSKPVAPEMLLEGLPSALQPSLEGQGETRGRKRLSPSDHHDNDLENAVYKPPALLPPRILPLLHTLAQEIVKAGNGKQLLTIYRETRSCIIEESLYKLGVGKLVKGDGQKVLLEGLEAKIAKWVQFIRISVKLLFAGERKICDQIFEGMASLKDLCFAEVTVSSFSALLGFAMAIAQSKQSPDKLFVLLDMYEVLRELQPEIEILFEGRACSEIRESTLGLINRLAQIAKDTIGDLEELVEKDPTKSALLVDGTVHPLTSYVINYVKFLIDYRTTLKKLFQEFGDGEGTDSQLASVTMRVIQALQTNLYGKSKKYKDPALAQLFLMNNVHYIVRSVRRIEAKDLLGDDWVQRHRRIVQQHANQYQRIAWTKILQSLSIQGLWSSSGGGSSVDGGNSSGVSRTKVKDRLKMFNMQFEDLQMKQSQWTVRDNELRESLRLAVAEVLLPAYRSFLKRFGTIVENEKTPQRYVKYTPEDLTEMLGDFFEGK